MGSFGNETGFTQNKLAGGKVCVCVCVCVCGKRGREELDLNPGLIIIHVFKMDIQVTLRVRNNIVNHLCPSNKALRLNP